MQTSQNDIYAVGLFSKLLKRLNQVGDVIETNDAVFPERRATVALGNIANMQGRIAADHALTGKSIAYKGICILVLNF